MRLGCDWDPTLPYLTDCMALMVRPPLTLPIPPQPTLASAGGIVLCEDGTDGLQPLKDNVPDASFVTVGNKFIAIVRSCASRD